MSGKKIIRGMRAAVDHAKRDAARLDKIADYMTAQAKEGWYTILVLRRDAKLIVAAIRELRKPKRKARK